MAETHCVERLGTVVSNLFSEPMALFEDLPPFALMSPMTRDAGHLPGRISISRNGDHQFSSIRPVTNRSSKSKMSFTPHRPSTAYNGARVLHEEGPCPSPIVRRSQDGMDMHDALRLQIPPFRQSRRWAKAYAAPNVQSTQPIITRKSSLGKHSQGLSCDTTKSSHMLKGDDTVQRSDTESDHYRGCKPVSVPGWHAFKQRRLLKRHSIPSKNTRSTGLRSPKRAKSAKSLASGFQSSPQRAGLPKLVQSNSVGRLKQQDRAQESTSHQDIGNATETAFLPGPPSLFDRQEYGGLEHTRSPVQSLHDPQKVKRFSQECVDILALDSRADWHLSVFGPLLPPSPEKSGGSRTSIQSKLLDQPSGSRDIHSPSIPRRGIDRAPDPPVRTSSKRGGIAGPANFKQVAKPACLPVLEGFRDNSLHAAHDADDEADDRLSLMRQSIRRDRSRTSYSQQSKLKHVKDLKTARSVDTLSRIEAQVVPSPSDASVSRLRGTTISARPSSLTASTPSGQPPERPLPKLPQTEQPIVPMTDEDPPANDFHAGRGPDATIRGQDDAFKISSIHTLIAIPSYTPTCAENVGFTEQHAKTQHDCVPAQHLSFADRVARSMSIDRQSSRSSSTEAPSCSTLKAKAIANNRSSRTQEIKRRHLAAWSKSLCIASTRDNSGEEDALLDVRPYMYSLEPDVRTCRLMEPRSADDLRSTGHNEFSTSTQSLGKSTDAFEIGELDKFPSVPTTPPGGQPISAGDLKPPQDLDRKSSRKSSRSQRRSAESRLMDSTSPMKQSRENSKRSGIVKQTLGHSHIMVVVDTNPHTSSFRAGAISPNPQPVRLTSRPASPIVKNPAQSSQAPTQKSLTAHLDSSMQSIDTAVSVKPYDSQRKPGLHKARSHPLNLQTTATGFGVESLQKASPASLEFHTDLAPCHYYMNDESVSDQEGTSSTKQIFANNPSQTHKMPRKNTRKLHRRQDTPLTVMLKEEVQRADQELENLKKYERRIECLQMQLEETLEIWGRMRQGEKKQYLATNFCASKVQNDTDVSNRGNGHGAMTTAASSIYSKRSSADRLKQEITRGFDQASTSLRDHSIEEHRISNTSDLFLTGTGTDTDNSVQTSTHQPGKRASDGSLTDPQDYDITALPQHKTGQAKQNGKPGCPDAASDCSDPMCETHVSSFRHSRLCPTPIMSQEGFMSLQERAEVVPWEQHEHTVPCTNSSTDTLSNHRLSINHEIFRTDQMDALLIM